MWDKFLDNAAYILARGPIGTRLYFVLCFPDALWLGLETIREYYRVENEWLENRSWHKKGI